MQVLNANPINIQTQLLQVPIPVGLSIIAPSPFPCNNNGNDCSCDTPGAGNNCIYYVMPNDTYTTIARLLNSFSTIVDMTPLELARFNGSTNVNNVLPLGSEVRIPNCVNTVGNNCGQLLADMELYLCRQRITGIQASIGYARVNEGSILVPVLVLVGVNNGTNIFVPPIPANTYLTPLDTSFYQTEAPLPANARLYSLESVEDFLSVRTGKAYTCSGAMTFRSRVQRSDCTSVYVYFAEVLGSTMLTSLGARGDTPVLRITRASGIQIPAWLQAFVNSGTAVIRNNPATSQFPMGSQTIIVNYDSFVGYMVTQGVAPCEAEGGIIPPDGEDNCDEIIERVTPIIERSLGANSTPFRVVFGAVRGRGPILGTYNPAQFIVPVIVVVGHADIIPFDGKQVAGACLLPLSMGNYSLVFPNLSATELQRTSIFDMASVIAFLATDTTFNSNCAAVLSRQYNQSCSSVIEALEDDEFFDASAGTRPAALSARYEGIAVRRVVNPGTVIPAWVLTSGGTVTERTVEGEVLNKAIVLPVPNLMRYRQLGGQASCSFTINQVNNLNIGNVNGINTVNTLSTGNPFTNLVTNNINNLSSDLNGFNGFNNINNNGLNMNGVNGLNNINNGLNMNGLNNNGNTIQTNIGGRNVTCETTTNASGISSYYCYLTD